MDNKCFWLPELIDFNDYNNDWHKYDDYLYSIFSKHFLENHPYFMGKEVYPRQHPMYNGKFESYYHITCGHYKDVEERAPDFRRCERIKWPKALIENLCVNVSQIVITILFGKRNIKTNIDIHYY